MGINSVEQFIGDYGLEHKLRFEDMGEDTGKRIAIIGGGDTAMDVVSVARHIGHIKNIHVTIPSPKSP